MVATRSGAVSEPEPAAAATTRTTRRSSHLPKSTAQAAPKTRATKKTSAAAQQQTAEETDVADSDALNEDAVSEVDTEPVDNGVTEVPDAQPSTETGVTTIPTDDEATTLPSQSTETIAEKVAPSTLQKPKFEYEFMGPFGAAFIMLALPAVVMGLYYGCNAEFCLTNSYIKQKVATVGHEQQLSEQFTAERAQVMFEAANSHVLHAITHIPFSWTAVQILGGWYALQILLERFLPAEILTGVPLSDGRSLKYRVNGHLAFWVSLLLLGHCWPHFTSDWRLRSFGSFDLSLLYHHYAELAVLSCGFSIVLSLVLYAVSFRNRSVELAKPGTSGNPIYDLFMGRELNPRIGGRNSTFDLKYFCELRPGIIGWLILDIGMAAKQIAKYGFLTHSMIVLLAAQGMYVWDALYHERAILTTMDITSDGFGFMLAFGDLAWVPFTYSLQARYLVDRAPLPNALPPWYWFAVFGLHLVGYTLFRSANSQKDAFRRNPNDPAVAHLRYMQTARGTKLITSGYWGMARKINYTGDWLMGLSWCLCCGFDSIVPYFYAIYFGILLVHRALRDDHACHAKYGDDWIAYKRAVPYMFIPYVI